MDEPETHLTPKEAGALNALSRDATPPEQLEERVVAALRQQGMLRRPRSWTLAASFAAAIAIALATGYWWGARAAGTDGATTPIEASESIFALLVYDAAVAAAAGQDSDSAAVAEASEWAAGLERDGSLVLAEKLHSDGRRIEQRDGRVELLTGFPPTGADLVLGGLFLVRAQSYDEAQRIAATCPLLRYGSTIEIRAFEES